MMQLNKTKNLLKKIYYHDHFWVTWVFESSNLKDKSSRFDFQLSIKNYLKFELPANIPRTVIDIVMLLYKNY